VSIDNILGSLDNVRKSGNAKWRAPCPVHKGKDRNLMISERSDGSVGCYCFVCGAGGPDVMQSLGLDLKEIFAPDSKYERPVITKKMQEEETMDRLVIEMAKVNPPKTLEDTRRVQLAQARLEGIQGKRDQLSQQHETKSVDDPMPF
jgi:hypothetical protein